MKKIVTILLLIIGMMFMVNVSYAKSSFQPHFDLTGDSVSKRDNPINPGETIKLKLNVSNVNIESTTNALKGIKNLSLILDYDTNVFEPIEADEQGQIPATSKSTITPLSTWAKPTYSSKRKMLVMKAESMVLNGQTSDVMEISLKVKDSATAKQTTVTLKEITVSNGESDVDAPDMTLTIGSNKTPVNPTPTPTPAPTTTPTPTPTPTPIPTKEPTPTPTNEVVTAKFIFDAENKAKTEKPLKAGDTIKVKLNLSNIKLNKGVASLLATLDYDKNVFELIESDSTGNVTTTSQSTIKKLGTWSDPVYSSKNNQFTMKAGGWQTADGDVFELAFKVKKDTKVEQSIVTLKEFSVSNGFDEEELKNVSVTLGTKANPTPTPTPTPTAAPTPKELPKTGAFIAPVLIIMVIIATGVVSYIKYRKM